MNKVENCPICLKHIQPENKNYIFENDLIKVYHGPLESNIIGYLYIETKRHVENWFELNEHEMLEMSNMVKMLSSILKKEINAERVYTVTISEAIRHLHIHVIPRGENENVKGLKLIEKATQKKVDTKNELTQMDIDILISCVKEYLKIHYRPYRQ
ncbi:HIT family protein [Metabacillus halosaccharovorans]|uniref:HIT domain-containing protein n=1 Tax=Metabacillus halosaccharovorans TaxID=930124 RepID=A0ABT3DBX6_9BACI|nr:HIT domain-containing protein [Metabacillus halosaccharovorans]MCV9884484.1 HIT domain-containing protein [Metabacillus halosaccharovorans]